MKYVQNCATLLFSTYLGIECIINKILKILKTFLVKINLIIDVYFIAQSSVIFQDIFPKCY
jgi:hypothetical protein